MTPAAQWIEDSRLWLVLDRAAARPRSLPEATRLCIEGGVDAVVFRMKDADAIEAASDAARVRQVCRKAGVPFVLAHFHELVTDLQPDAFHAGIADGALTALRFRLPKEVALGYSAHAVAEARDAIEQGAEYVFLGPVFATPSKEQYGPPIGLEVVEPSAELDAPLVYIGGLDSASIPQVIAAGGRRIAAVSALLAVPDPRAAARELKALLQA